MEPKTHETPEPVRKLEELEHVADVGEDERTPFILIGGVLIVCAVVVLVVLAISLFAFHIVS